MGEDAALNDAASDDAASGDTEERRPAASGSEPAVDRPAAGTRLVFRWRKWDGSEHWQHDSVYLGSDAYGDWIGQPAGARSFRPGRDYLTATPSVTLMPAEATTWAFTHNAAPASYDVYIDIAWDVRWRDAEPTAIDMDLDVIRTWTGRTFLDDEDEWAEHAEQFGYPADVRTTLPVVASDLLVRVERREPPFDGATAARWLAVLEECAVVDSTGD